MNNRFLKACVFFLLIFRLTCHGIDLDAALGDGAEAVVAEVDVFEVEEAAEAAGAEVGDVVGA